MKLKFLNDFRGRETGEQFFKAGEVGEFDEPQARALLAGGRAILVDIQPVAVADEKHAELPAKKGRRK